MDYQITIKQQGNIIDQIIVRGMASAVEAISRIESKTVRVIMPAWDSTNHRPAMVNWSGLEYEARRL